MPKFGNVDVSDSFAQTLRTAAPPPRPGLGAVVAASAQNAYGQVRYGLPYAAEKIAGTLSAADEAEYQAGLQRADAAGAAAPAASLADMTSGRVGIARWIGENLAASAPQTISTLAGGVAGGLVGGPIGALAGAVAVGTPQFVGSNVGRAVQENGTLSTEAAERSIVNAPAQAASDVLVERFLPGAGSLIGNFAAHQTGNFLARTAKSIVKAGATEAVTEAGQQMAERQAAGLDLTGADAAAEYVNAAVTAFAVGGVMGSAGGFRRSAAVAKPAAAVTNEDMSEHIDRMLQLSGPDGAAPLALPAPDPNAPTVAQRPETADFVADRRGNIAPVVGGDQVAAESAALAVPSGDVVVDAQGNAAVGPDADQQLVAARNTPDDGSAARRDFLAELAQRGPLAPTGLDMNAPGIQELLGRMGQPIPGADPVAAPNPAASPLAIATATEGLNPTPTAVDTAGARTFTAEPLAEIEKAAKAKTASPALRQHAADELSARWAEAAGTTPLTGEFTDRLDALKSGLRNQFVQKLTATDPADLVTKVYDEVLVNQNTSSGVVKLAQRVGLLDADLNPTPMADTIEAERTAADVAEAQPAAAPAPVGTPVAVAPAVAPDAAPAAATPAATTVPDATPAAAPTPAATPTAVSLAPTTVDPAFGQQWNQLKSEAGINRERSLAPALKATPANIDAARAEVFRALATDDADVEVSQTEAMARKMGLVTDDANMDITPLGRTAYLATPEGVTDAANAARVQGFTGTQEAAFAQGVREAASGQAGVAHTTFEDLAAAEAGKVWARDVIDNDTTKSTPQSQAIQARLAARNNGVAVDRTTVRAELTPEQITQRAQNRLLDAANLSTTADSDVAALRAMVRDGVSDADLGAALAQLQGGQTLFTQPDPVERPVTGEKPSRGQPRFVELNPETVTRQTRAQMRLDAEAARRVFAARTEIRDALMAKEINVTRADKLNDMLDDGKIAQVEQVLSARATDADARSSGPSDVAFEQALTGKSFAEAVQHMVDTAPSPYLKAVMLRVQATMNNILAAGGHEFNLVIAKVGTQVPGALHSPRTRALATVTKVPATATVWLKSADLGPAAGTNFQVAAHEMLHAVTMQALNFGRLNSQADTRLGKAVRDLRDLGNAIVDHFNDRVRSGAKLTDFEKALYARDINAISSQDEILAWGMTNPDMQEYLQGIAYTPKQSLFGRMVELLRGVLGLTNAKYDTALTELLRVSEAVMGATGRDLAPAFERSGPTTTMAALQAETSDAGMSAANRTVEAANTATMQAADFAAKVTERVNIADLKGKARRVGLALFSQNHIDRTYGHLFPGMLERTEAKRAHDAVRGRFASMGDTAYQNYEALQQKNPAHAKLVGELMRTTTEFQLDPNKSFDDHTHLEDHPERVQLAALHKRVLEMKNTLSRGDQAGIKVFNEFRARNETMNLARLASDLHALVATDREFSLGVEGSAVNPMDVFMTQPDLSSTEDIRAYWQEALNGQIAAATAFVTKKMGEAAAGTASDQLGAQQHLSSITEKIASTHQALAGMARAPYFHLGRFGDHFASATIRKLESGTVDPRAQRHVAETFEKAGFSDIQLSVDNTRPKFSARFEKLDQRQRFEAVLRDLEKGGWIEPGFKSGPVSREGNFGVSNDVPKFVRRAIVSLETDPRFTPAPGMSPADRAALETRKQDAIQAITDTWLESQPDNAISKVLTARYTVPGFTPEMIRSFAHRWNVGSTNLAEVSTKAKSIQAYENMRAQATEAMSSEVNEDPDLLADLHAEIQKRDAHNPINATAGTLDKLRSFGHAYYLGLSPAYGAIQLMQIGTNALPELAKKNGYGKSFHALRRASSDALAIMKASSAESAKLGPAHYADVALTENVLKASNLPKGKLDFLRHMIATGALDIGSSANALSQIARHGTGSKMDVAMKYASAIGMHTETYSRLVTALAAHDLHGGEDVQAAAKYAGNVVSNSMFDYQSWNTSRALGKQGFAGPITPLLTQFMTYSAQMTEKLYSEAASAIGRARPGETAEQTATRAKEARTYLVGHLTAITALAGTLGLPFASVFATAIEKMVGSKDEPYDATAAWRNFLASVLGKDTAEVVSRGLPRAIGVDISSRVGESDLLPFSQLLSDKRSWSEAVSASLGRSAGASPEMLINIADAGTAFGNGDVIGGMKMAMPIAFKGPLEAYRMSTEGYVDTKGRKLPMTPGASAILSQLMGFTPAEKAEYSEARGDQQSRRAGLTARSAMMRQRIVRAMTSGDDDGARELIADAMEFDRANPTFSVMKALPGALQRQTLSTATARSLGTPLGVPLADIAGRALTGYANTGY